MSKKTNNHTLKNDKIHNHTVINFVVPMAGGGASFQQAGYTFPKPLIDVNGKPMIQLVVENLKPTTKHSFIFICKQEHYEKYSLHEIFQNISDGHYECIKLFSPTRGAACTVLTSIEHINNDQELIISNSDQVIDISMDAFIQFCRKSKADGVIMTFPSSHPRWSYARIDKNGAVLEVAEKKVISDHATVGIYYFKKGRMFVEAAFSMIQKNISFNNEFYVCPVYNELILQDATIATFEIDQRNMHSLGTPEDLQKFERYFLQKSIL